MTVTIPTDSEQFVLRKIAAGPCRSAEEVVAEGLRVLEEREAGWRGRIEAGWNDARSGNLRTPAAAQARLSTLKADWKARNPCA